MIHIKRLETIEIEGTIEEEVQELIDYYLNKGYKLEEGIFFSDEEGDEYPYFAYVQKDEFS